MILKKNETKVASRLILLRCQFRTWYCLFLAPWPLQQHANYAATLKFVVNLGSDGLRLSPVRNSLAVFFLCVGTSQQVANSYLPRPAGLMLSVSGFLNPSTPTSQRWWNALLSLPAFMFRRERVWSLTRGKVSQPVFDWLLERLHHCPL